MEGGDKIEYVEFTFGDETVNWFSVLDNEGLRQAFDAAVRAGSTYFAATKWTRDGGIISRDPELNAVAVSPTHSATLDDPEKIWENVEEVLRGVKTLRGEYFRLAYLKPKELVSGKVHELLLKFSTKDAANPFPYPHDPQRSITRLEQKPVYIFFNQPIVYPEVAVCPPVNQNIGVFHPDHNLLVWDQGPLLAADVAVYGCVVHNVLIAVLDNDATVVLDPAVGRFFDEPRRPLFCLAEI